MFVVMIERVVKMNTGSTEKFAPRSSNHKTWHFAGPFRTRRAAERSAVAALATHTCLCAQVWSEADLESWRDPQRYGSNYGLENAVIDARKRVASAQVTGLEAVPDK
jgi:hypothetical protein